MAEEKDIERIQELAYSMINRAGCLMLVKVQVDELTQDIHRAEKNEARFTCIKDGTRETCDGCDKYEECWTTGGGTYENQT